MICNIVSNQSARYIISIFESLFSSLIQILEIRRYETNNSE